MGVSDDGYLNLLRFKLSDATFILSGRKETNIGKLSNGYFNLFNGSIRIIGNMDIDCYILSVMVNLLNVVVVVVVEIKE